MGAQQGHVSLGEHGNAAPEPAVLTALPPSQKRETLVQGLFAQSRFAIHDDA